jgi:hypothetical protein
VEFRTTTSVLHYSNTPPFLHPCPVRDSPPPASIPSQNSSFILHHFPCALPSEAPLLNKSLSRAQRRKGVGGGSGNLTPNATAAVPPGFPYPGAGFSGSRKMSRRGRPPSGCREGISVPFRPRIRLPWVGPVNDGAYRRVPSRPAPHTPLTACRRLS